MKKVINLFWQSLAIMSVKSIFENDSHEIVSKRGWKILNEKTK